MARYDPLDFGYRKRRRQQFAWMLLGVFAGMLLVIGVSRMSLQTSTPHVDVTRP